MQRLEHIRTIGKLTARREAKTPYGALVALAQLAPEKRRLQQERANWERRIHKIEARVKEIAGIEEQLWAVAQCEPSSADHKRPAEVSGGLPPGFTEVTVRY
jgi:hypothetical protein